ncbi:hypothetical protein LSH36_185g04007 [Paralvinella palmiformis]|uniref:G-protein coupled receptors family 1 profile domain-containing protein n=1 Tax=Paralvinella palmiformis TaxID=53620 RepID=A0AAD9JQV1_9ANNE|nr:hypothetical protein LSH36_185g04007 [Paralvinella palmiformis]
MVHVISRGAWNQLRVFPIAVIKVRNGHHSVRRARLKRRRRQEVPHQSERYRADFVPYSERYSLVIRFIRLVSPPTQRTGCYLNEAVSNEISSAQTHQAQLVMHRMRCTLATMDKANSSLAFASSADGSNVTSDLIEHANAASRLELYIVMGILSFLSVMGTAGNALVLYVFSQKKDKLVSTLFIIVLAFVDFITCLIVIPYTIYMEYVEFYIDYDALCKSYQFLITSNIPFSAMIMVAIAVDRYFCICHPFLRALNLFRAKIMIGGLALLAAVIGICVALMYGVYQHVPVAVAAAGNGTERTANGRGGYPDDIDLRDLITSSSPDAAVGVDGRTIPYQSDDGPTAVNGSTETPPVYYKCIVQFTGSCEPNELIINSTFRWYYQKFYTALYLVCLIIVVVLYTLIYRSVLARRTKRQKQKSKSLPLIQMSNERTLDTTTEETMLTAVSETANGGSKPSSVGVKNGATSKAAVKSRDRDAKEKEKQRRKSMKKDRNRMANLKTAAMLFVVTVVFIVTFCPAFLMANMIIPYNMIVFYMYFANNVANPVIYSFMNKNFRDDLKRLFKC